MKDVIIRIKLNRLYVLISMFLVSTCLFVGVGYWKNGNITLTSTAVRYGLIDGADTSVSESASISKVSVFEENIEPLYDIPTRLYFEDVSIDIKLVEVGVVDDGTLDNPKDWGVGGWYHRSSMPGQIGNIIINAHYDNNFGAPAAFWELKNVEANDKVFLVNSLGKIYTYQVKETFYVGIDDPDRLRIFKDNNDKSELTLITCGGVWNYTAGTYDKRLVVKAELLDSYKSAAVMN